MAGTSTSLNLLQEVLKLRRHLDLSGFQPFPLVTAAEECAVCNGPLVIFRHRPRPLQTLQSKRLVVAKDKTCHNPECSQYKKPVRPVEASLLPMVRGSHYGLDVVAYIGEQRLTAGRALAEVHRELDEKFGVRISERHVANLFRIFLALVHCVNAEVDPLRQRLMKQGKLILSIDGVFFDDVSPALYVVRDLISNEILFSERVDCRDQKHISALLRRVRALGIPVVGIVSDKEHALVASAEEVYPEVPHQFCQTHYLKNITKLMEADLAELASAVTTASTQLRKIDRELNQRAEAADSTPAEKAMAKKLIDVAKAAAKTSGDAILNPPPLKRMERLQQVETFAEAAAAKPGGQWTLLASVVAVLSVVVQQTALVNRLRFEVGVVRKIAHILKSTSAVSQVRRVLSTYLNKLERGAPTRGRGAPRGDFMRAVVNLSNRYWPGLFHCYEIAGLPRNNNDLEQTFNVIKRMERKATGRKSTVGGPLESCAEFVLEAWSSLDAHPQVLNLLKDIPPDRLMAARKELENLANPAKSRRSIQRDPERHLDGALDEWLDP